MCELNLKPGGHCGKAFQLLVIGQGRGLLTLQGMIRTYEQCPRWSKEPQYQPESSGTAGSRCSPGVPVPGESERPSMPWGAAGQWATGRLVRQPGGASGISLPAALKAMRRKHFLGAVIVPHTPLRWTTHTAQRPAQIHLA